MAKNKIDVKNRVSSLSAIELRSVSEDIDVEGMIVEGYAVVFGTPTVLYVDEFGNEYKEIIDKNAFDEAIMTDVPFKYNHDDKCFVPSRTRIKEGEGSLVLEVDDYGLKIRAQFADTSSSRDLYRLIQLGLINKMSFAFTYDDDTFDSETHTTTITKINKLWDVSAVDDPAYPQTSISSLRSNIESERELMRKVELKNRELDNKRFEARKLQVLESKRKQEIDELKKRFMIDEINKRLKLKEIKRQLLLSEIQSKLYKK